jgi:ABC-2 type transport system ATP-binding protein
VTPVREAVGVGALTRVKGINLLSDSDGATTHMKVEGEMDGLIKALAAFPVTDLKTERPSLEEIFLAY